MLKFPIPIPDELNPLVTALLECGTDIYLSGFLNDNHLPFVDICWEASEKIQHRLPEGWALIYAYFISSEAVSRGESDPLLQGVKIETILETYTPKGFSEDDIEENRKSLVEQANYLLKFPPSRLVYLGSGDLDQADIDVMVSYLKVE